MFADIIKFVFSSVELVQTRDCSFERFLRRFVTGGCQVYVMANNSVR